MNENVYRLHTWRLHIRKASVSNKLYPMLTISCDYNTIFVDLINMKVYGESPPRFVFLPCVFLNHSLRLQILCVIVASGHQHVCRNHLLVGPCIGKYTGLPVQTSIFPWICQQNSWYTLWNYCKTIWTMLTVILKKYLTYFETHIFVAPHILYHIFFSTWTYTLGMVAI